MTFQAYLCPRVSRLGFVSDEVESRRIVGGASGDLMMNLSYGFAVHSEKMYILRV